MPANLLSTHGGLFIRASGWNEGGVGNKTVRLHFGSESITLGVVSAGSAGDWNIEAHIRLIAGSVDDVLVDWKWTLNGSPATINTDHTSIAVATNVDVMIKLTGECSSASDIIHQLTWIVKEE